MILINLLLLACFFGLPTSAHPSKQTYIQLPTGQYEGLHDVDTSTTVYYAIPYAFSSRFEASQSIDTKPGISPNHKINASKHGASCVNFNLPAPYDKGFEFFLGTEPIKSQSEDCLNMDIYVPDGDQKDLPVLFFSPGGGFLVTSSFPYDMRSLIQRGVEKGKPFVAVVVNYRLGPLGLLNPSTAEDWNLSILDQFKALEYVQKHISAFGGDPTKVTISGESAGAESTMHQLLWGDSSLFRSAWMMSVPSSGAPFLRTEPNNKDDLIQNFAQACGCPKEVSLSENIECLREVDVKTMTNQSEAWGGSGTSLGRFMPKNVFRNIRDGTFPHIPMVFSTCRDEGTGFAIGFNASSDAETAISVQVPIKTADRFTKAQSEKIVNDTLAAYPDDPSLGAPFDGRNTTYGLGAQFKRAAAISTDIMFVEPWVQYLQQFSRKNDVWGLSWEEAIPGPGIDPAFGVTHGTDLVYYFPTLLGLKNNPRRNGLGHIVDTLQTALVNFVVDGDPSAGCDGENDYVWPKFGDRKLVTRISGQKGAFADEAPRRAGFDVIRKSFWPKGF